MEGFRLTGRHWLRTGANFNFETYAFLNLAVGVDLKYP